MRYISKACRHLRFGFSLCTLNKSSGKKGYTKTSLFVFSVFLVAISLYGMNSINSEGGGGVMGKKFLTREVGRKLVSEGKKKKLVIFFNQQTHKEVT